MPFTKKIYSVSNGLPVDGINSMFYKSLDVTKPPEGPRGWLKLLRRFL